MEVAPEKIRITKLHLLVHPGFMAGPDAEHEPGHPTQDEISKSRALLDKYIAKAKGLGRDEIMVIFGYTGPDEFENHKREFAMYTDYIEKLQSLLGDRLILIEGNIDPFEEEVAFEEVEFIADERGYSIDTNTITEAFGETAQSCVLDCAQNFNFTGKFREETIIDLDLTDLFNESVDSVFVRNLIEGNRDSVSRVVFRKNGEIIN